MLINLRNALMTGKRLPYDAEVEYLESTGTQWIDTGYSFNSATDKVELVFELLTTTPNYKWIFGAYDSSKRFAIGSGDNANRRTFGYNASTSYYSSTYYTDGAHIFLADSTGASIDGHKFFRFADFSTTSHIILYSIPIDTPTSCSNARIWSYKHYRNGTLVRDYIPVRKGTTGELYDRVSGKFAGRHGDFVLGPDVVPVEYIQVAVANARIIPGVPLDSALLSQGVNIDLAIAVPNPGNNLGLLAQGTALTTAPWALSGGALSGAVKLFSYGSFNYSFGGIGSKTNILIEVSTSSVFATADGVRQGGGYSQSLSYGQRLVLLGYDSNSNSAPVGTRIYGYKMESNGLAKEHLLPVRVGTDATLWEGAMMDVLTRRIYRNAGTGAFTYGNDLKYPIPSE